MNAHGLAVERLLGRPVMSSFHGMFSLGAFGGAAVAGLGLLVLNGTTLAIAVASGLLALAAFAARWLLPAAVDRGAAGTAFALPRRATLGIGALLFIALMSEGAMLDWSALHLTTSFGAGPALAATGFAAFSAAMTLARFLGDRLRARMGSVPLVRLSAVLASAGLGFGVVAPIPWIALFGFACAGLGLANMVPVLFGAAGRTPGQNPATAIASVAAMGYMGFIAGPPAIGFVAEATSLAIALGLVAAGCAAVAFWAGAARAADIDLRR
jgi:hypothetical protein